jgi:hypothetical protein
MKKFSFYSFFGEEIVLFYNVLLATQRILVGASFVIYYFFF